MKSLQGITVAIATSGVDYFTRYLLFPLVQRALSSFSLSPTVPPINPPDIVLGSTNSHGWISRDTAESILVTLDSGSLQGFETAYVSRNQDDSGKGQFTLFLNAGQFKALFNWHETYTLAHYYAGSTTDSSQRVNGQCTIDFTALALQCLFQLEYENDAWQAHLVQVTPTPGEATPTIPSDSVLNHQESGGCGDTISDATRESIDTLDFRTPISAALQSLLASIPATGQITRDVSFQFEEGPDGITFPATGGIIAGVTGLAVYQGTAYPGPNPPTIPVPAIPGNRDLAYNVSDYTFNSLMWAFYSGGSLKRHVVPGDLPDPGVLNTNTYNNTPLQALYDAYPGLDMTADIVARAAPTVAFQKIYDLNDAGYATLQSQLPADVYSKLASEENQACLTQAVFDTKVANAVGQDSANKYQTIIEAAALVVAGVVTHDNQVVLNVVKDGNQIPVITFEVAQTDVLQDFALGISGAAQTLQFAFQIVPAMTRTTFISSSIQGIDSGDFGYIWNLVLQKEYAEQVAAIGKHGVALPRVSSLDFVFGGAVISLEEGFASVVTNVQHVSDPEYVPPPADTADMNIRNLQRARRRFQSNLKGATA